jgi:hypothetical protein
MSNIRKTERSSMPSLDEMRAKLPLSGTTFRASSSVLTSDEITLVGLCY